MTPSVLPPTRAAQGRLVEQRSNATYLALGLVGAGCYSEGLGDDLNKALWSALAQDARLSVNDVVQQYARYFFGADRVMPPSRTQHV